MHSLGSGNQRNGSPDPKSISCMLPCKLWWFLPQRKNVLVPLASPCTSHASVHEYKSKKDASSPKVRMIVIGPKWKLWWDPNENAIPWCICRGSGPVHSLCLCLLGLRSFAWRKKVQEIWNNQSSDLFHFIMRQTNKNCPPVHFCPKRSPRVPLTSVLPRFWSFFVWWLPDHLGSGLNSSTYSSTLQAHLTPSMTHEPCKHSLAHQWSKGLLL